MEQLQDYSKQGLSVIFGFVSHRTDVDHWMTKNEQLLLRIVNENYYCPENYLQVAGSIVPANKKTMIMTGLKTAFNSENDDAHTLQS